MKSSWKEVRINRFVIRRSRRLIHARSSGTLDLGGTPLPEAKYFSVVR
jgi:hypothetical protein